MSSFRSTNSIPFNNPTRAKLNTTITDLPQPLLEEKTFTHNQPTIKGGCFCGYRVSNISDAILNGLLNIYGKLCIVSRWLKSFFCSCQPQTTPLQERKIRQTQASTEAETARFNGEIQNHPHCGLYCDSTISLSRPKNDHSKRTTGLNKLNRTGYPQEKPSIFCPGGLIKIQPNTSTHVHTISLNTALRIEDILPNYQLGNTNRGSISITGLITLTNGYPESLKETVKITILNQLKPLSYCRICLHNDVPFKQFSSNRLIHQQSQTASNESKKLLDHVELMLKTLVKQILAQRFSCELAPSPSNPDANPHLKTETINAHISSGSLTIGIDNTLITTHFNETAESSPLIHKKPLPSKNAKNASLTSSFELPVSYHTESSADEAINQSNLLLSRKSSMSSVSSSVTSFATAPSTNMLHKCKESAATIFIKLESNGYTLTPIVVTSEDIVEKIACPTPLFFLQVSASVISCLAKQKHSLQEIVTLHLQGAKDNDINSSTLVAAGESSRNMSHNIESVVLPAMVSEVATCSRKNRKLPANKKVLVKPQVSINSDIIMARKKVEKLARHLVSLATHAPSSIFDSHVDNYDHATVQWWQINPELHNLKSDNSNGEIQTLFCADNKSTPPLATTAPANIVTNYQFDQPALITMLDHNDTSPNYDTKLNQSETLQQTNDFTIQDTSPHRCGIQ